MIKSVCYFRLPTISVYQNPWRFSLLIFTQCGSRLVITRTFIHLACIYFGPKIPSSQSEAPPFKNKRQKQWTAMHIFLENLYIYNPRHFGWSYSRILTFYYAFSLGHFENFSQDLRFLSSTEHLASNSSSNEMQIKCKEFP